MSESYRFTLNLEHRLDYEFKVKFDKKILDDLLVDEPPPLGNLAGPNPARLLAVSVANCLCASLLYCIKRDELASRSLNAEVEMRLSRNEKKRLRVSGIHVVLKMSDKLVSEVKAKRCLALFENFCVVTESVRNGIAIDVEVQDTKNNLLYSSTNS